MHSVHSALCLLAIFGTAFGDPKLDGPLHIEREKVEKVEVTLTETLSGFSGPAERWVVNAAAPPGYEAQTVHSAYFYIPTEPTLKTNRLKEKAGLGQTYLSISFAHPSSRPVTAQAIYEVTIYKRKMVEGPSPEKPFPLGNQKLHYTASHPWLDMGNADFKAWLKEEELLKKPGETDLKYAWRVFKDISAKFSYDPDAEGLTPLATINAKESNTLGLANLYLAILRIADVPSRFVVGRPLAELKDQKVDISDTRLDEEYTDVLVEFWVDEIGWIPADIVHAAGHHEPSDYFGKTEGDFVAFHFDMFQFERGQYSFLERLDWLKNDSQVLQGTTVQRKIELRKL